jgi:hypothetical protein
MNRPKRNWKIIILVFVGIVFSGCKTIEYFTIDVMEPAELYLPIGLDTILIAHNAFPDTSKPAGTPFVIYGQMLRDTAFRDSALARKAITTLDNMLAEIGRFEAVLADTLGKGLPDKPEEYTEADILKIRKWCSQHGARAFLILTSLEKQISYDIYYGMFGNSVGEFSASISGRWLLINPFASKLIDGKVMRDTLYLPVKDPYGRNDEENYQNSIQLLDDAAAMMGINYGSYISPHFAQTSRMIFKSGNRQIKQGYEKAAAGDWRSAAVIWREALSEPDNKVRAKASFNLAVANEMEGLLESALEWAEQSYQFFPDTINTTYIEILKERIKNQEEIILQMEGEGSGE